MTLLVLSDDDVRATLDMAGQDGFHRFDQRNLRRLLQQGGVRGRTEGHSFRDVLHPLEQLGNRLQRHRAAHLRQRFELLLRFHHVEALE